MSQPASTIPVPPQNLEAEQAVIGALMSPVMDPAAPAPDASLTRDHFYYGPHQLIFDAIRRLRARNEPTDVLMVAGELNGRLEQVGGRSYLLDCLNSVTSLTHTGHYARLVTEAAARRRLIYLGENLLHGAHGDEPVDTIIANAADSLEGMRSSLQPSALTFRSAWDVLQSAKTAGPMAYLPMLARDGYFAIGWSNLVSGYPKGGKTELVWSSVQQWLKSGLEVVWATEEGERVWGERLQKVDGGEDTLTESDFRRLTLLYSLGIPPSMILAALVQRPETVVIVDTVRTLMGIENELDNALVAQVFGLWEPRLMGRTRIYLHHARKQGGERGQRISGASAFLACIDRALEVEYGETKTQRVVTVISRIVEPQPLLYEMRKGRLLALGDPGALQLEEVMNRIGLVLSGEWTATRKVLESLADPLPSLDTVSRALTALAKGGRAERNPPMGEDAQGKRIAWRAVQGPVQTSLPLYKDSLSGSEVDSLPQ